MRCDGPEANAGAGAPEKAGAVRRDRVDRDAAQLGVAGAHQRARQARVEVSLDLDRLPRAHRTGQLKPGRGAVVSVAGGGGMK